MNSIMIDVVGKTYMKPQNLWIQGVINDKQLGTVAGRSLGEELFVFNCQRDPVLRFIDL